jgi:hypothetical protein
MEKEFNEQESLRLITNMITQAKERFQRKNGDGIILWGYSIAILALANFVLLQVLEEGMRASAYWVWACTIPLFIVNHFNEARKAQKAHVKNYINDMVGYVWLAFFISTLILVVSTFVLAVIFREYHGGILFLIITPVIMAATGLCLFINGKLCRIRSLVYGATIFWTGALLSVAILIIWKEQQGMQFLVLSFCVILGFILPGHSLNRKIRQDV